jgi:superfamily I DNA/RNA helicase
VKKIDENSSPDSLLKQEQIDEFIARLEEIKSLPGITLSTIHGMKGLESDHVFLIFCDKKVLPKKEQFANE